MTSWHTDPEVLARYADGQVDRALAASIEVHVMTCELCRELLGSRTESSRLDAIFGEVIDDLDRPPARFTERLLTRLGVPTGLARLLVLTPLLRASWLVSVFSVTGFALLAADARGNGAVVFLMLAPLAPVAGIAAAFGPRLDAAYEVAVASPYSMARLVMARAVAVLTTTALVGVVASPFVPTGGGALPAWTWLLPALLLAAVTVALAQHVDPLLAAGVVSAVWVVLIWVDRARPDPYLLATGTGQLVCGALAMAAAAAAFVGHDRLNNLGGKA
jgi:hypothetical protein